MSARKMCTLFSTVFCTSLFISQYVFVDSSREELPYYVNGQNQDNLNTQSPEYLHALSPEPILDSLIGTSMRFEDGVVSYYIDEFSYDTIITNRIRAAMDLIEASSCVIFKRKMFAIAPEVGSGSWIHFTNPNSIRECVHEPTFGDNGEIVIVIGFECMTSRNIVHAVLHGIGFKDEVSHPQRDLYIRIVWNNIQPRYRDLFAVHQQNPQYKMVEYDPMSIMHFHDRAFSINGGPTIAPRVPGLQIKPSEKLSQLDVMKLRMWFGHECNKRKVNAVIEKCKSVLHGSQQLSSPGKDVSIEVDNIQDPYVQNQMESEEQVNLEDNENQGEVNENQGEVNEPDNQNDRYIDGGDDDDDVISGGDVDSYGEKNEVDYGVNTDNDKENAGDYEVNADSGINGAEAGSIVKKLK